MAWHEIKLKTAINTVGALIKDWRIFISHIKFIVFHIHNE